MLDNSFISRKRASTCPKHIFLGADTSPGELSFLQRAPHAFPPSPDRGLIPPQNHRIAARPALPAPLRSSPARPFPPRPRRRLTRSRRRPCEAAPLRLRPSRAPQRGAGAPAAPPRLSPWYRWRRVSGPSSVLPSARRGPAPRGRCRRRHVGTQPPN